MSQLKDVEHKIAEEIFYISRVIVDDSFHTLLEPFILTKLTLMK